MEDNYQIQTLVETKDFDALTNTERAIVLQQITMEEYQARRNLMVSTRAFFKQTEKQLIPDKSIRLTVAARLAAQKQAQGTGILQRILYYRIPAAIPGLAFLLLLISGGVYFNQTRQQLLVKGAEKQPRIIYKTNTVKVEKEVPKYVTVPVIKYMERKAAPPVNTFQSQPASGKTSAAIEDAAPSNLPSKFNPQQLQQQMNNLGLANKDEEALNKFLVVSR